MRLVLNSVFIQLCYNELCCLTVRLAEALHRRERRLSATPVRGERGKFGYSKDLDIRGSRYMNLRIIILLVLGMSISFSIILGVLVTSRHREASRERLPVLRAPTTEELAASHWRRVASLTSKNNEVRDSKINNINKLEYAESIVADHEDWSIDRLQLTKTEPAQADFRAPSKHLDRMQAELMRQVQTLRESRDLMLAELAQQFEQMTAAQIVTELKVLDNESAAIALAKLSKKKRGAVLERLDDKRARTLGRLARNYVSQNREG